MAICETRIVSTAQHCFRVGAVLPPRQLFARRTFLRFDLAGRIGQSGVTRLCARRSICIAFNPAFLGAGIKTMRRVFGVICALGAVAVASCGGTNHHSAAQASRPEVARSRAVLVAAVKPFGTCPELVFCAPAPVRRAGSPRRAPAAPTARSTRCPTLVYCPPSPVRRAGSPRRAPAAPTARSTRCPTLVYCPPAPVRRAGAGPRMTP